MPGTTISRIHSFCVFGGGQIKYVEKEDASCGVLVVTQRFWRVFGSIVHAGLGLVHACEERAQCSGLPKNFYRNGVLAGFGSCVGVLLKVSLLRIRLEIIASTE